MDPKTKRIDAGIPSECERLVERGHLALIAITSEAHAARVEAQRTELEVALLEARSGDAGMLRSWLENYRGISESPNAERIASATLSKPTAATCLPFDSRESAAPLPFTAISEPEQPMGWERLLSGARKRLEARTDMADSLRVSQAAPQCETATTTDNSRPLYSEQQVTANVDPIAATAESATAEPADAKIENTQGIHESLSFLGEETLNEEELHAEQEELTDESDSRGTIVYQELAELQILADADRDLRKPLIRSGTRGLIVSIVVHVALISTLMAITMHIPDEVASLGFEAGSSESPIESLEDLQPIEVTSTEEVSPELPSETNESSVSLPSAVGLSSTSVNTASANPASNMSGVQASANRALAATSGRPNPSNANASFFGAAASGNCFCYVIDGSESMRGGPWEAAKAELLRSLLTMKENHRFYIIFFNQNLNAITMPGEREPATSPLYATAENLKHAQNWIESLRIERGAPPNAALLNAIEIEPDAIYLLADGATKIDVPAFLRDKNRTSDFISGEQVRVPIHAIAFYSPESGQKLMKQVAMENKGQFIYVPAPRKK